MAADQQDSKTDGPVYLTTKEVADLLRVRERKVYDLAAAGEIPHRRITGKLLFPRTEITAWIEGSAAMGGQRRPVVLTGSHDPLLDWAVRESGCGLATLLNGSTDGLAAFAEGRAALTGLHIPEAAADSPSSEFTPAWNVGTVEAMGLSGCVLIGWAVRSRGLLLGEEAGSAVREIADLRGRRIVLRQPGAGARTLFDRLVAAHGIEPADFTASGQLARTESDAAAAVAAGEADIAIGIEAMARSFRLGFLPLVLERFDLLVDRHAYFTEPVQSLLEFARTPTIKEKAASLTGYDLADFGKVRWLSP